MNVLIAIDEGAFLDCIEKFVTSREWPPRSHFLVLHVVEPPSEVASFLPNLIKETIVHDAHQYGLHLVRRMALRVRDYFKTEHVEELVKDGRAKEVIISTAKDWSADLIVMGSHNKSTIERISLGSVSETVLNTAPCSVVIARPAVAADRKSSAESGSKETSTV
jgi:nucleotide-binding universal stress UspA family protein